MRSLKYCSIYQQLTQHSFRVVFETRPPLNIQRLFAKNEVYTVF